MGEDWQRPTGAAVGRVLDDGQGFETYVSHLVRSAPNRFDGLKVVIDCANGAASQTAPEALRRLGAEVITYASTPDGLNINLDCGSTHMEGLRREVIGHGADLGIALDGDADRCLAVDATGELVDGDQILAVLALSMRDGGTAAQRHRRRDRDEQPRLRPGDGPRADRGRADQGRRPLRARGDEGRRPQARRRTVGPRDPVRPRHHRRRHSDRRDAAGPPRADRQVPARPGRRDDPPPAGPGQRARTSTRPGPAPTPTYRPLWPQPPPAWAIPAGFSSARPAPSPWSASWSKPSPQTPPTPSRTPSPK